MSIKVRPYSSDDADALASIYYHTIHNINRRDYSPEQLDAWAPKSCLDASDWLKKFEKTRPLVAIANGKPVGFVELLPSGYIDCFYCHHEWQGKGIGSALMTAVLDKAEELQIPLLSADVSITAKPFFEHKGFQVVNEQSVELRGLEFCNYKMERVLKTL